MFSSRFTIWVSFILPYRWLIVIAISLIAISYELFELWEGEHAIGGILFAEILLLGALLPLLIGFALTLVASTETKRQQTDIELKLNQSMQQQLNSASNWEDLKKVIIQFPQKITFFPAAYFLLYNRKIHLLELVEESGNTQNGQTLPLTIFEEIDQFKSKNSLYQLDQPKISFLEQGQENICYCLPLNHGNQFLGCLLLFRATDEPLAMQEFNLLNELSSVISISIDALHPEGSILLQETSALKEQQRLARYLHDTVGQDLSYLLLKLNAFEAQVTEPSMQQELINLANVANQAYEQIRLTLTVLSPQKSTDLASALLMQANLIGQERANFDVKLLTDGQPQELSPYTLQKIFGIFREVIINVQKHAQASLVEIDLLWTGSNLEISIKDNGRGFDLDRAFNNGHYGIEIMQERIKEINGRLTINSELNKGSKITLNIPVA